MEEISVQLGSVICLPATIRAPGLFFHLMANTLPDAVQKLSSFHVAYQWEVILFFVI